MKKKIKTLCSVKNCNCDKKSKKAWILKSENGTSLYWRRPSARFEYMFKNAVPVLITFIK